MLYSYFISQSYFDSVTTTNNTKIYYKNIYIVQIFLTPGIILVKTTGSFRMFNLCVTCLRTPTISDLFLFSLDVQPPGNYSLYNIVQKHFTIYLSLNRTSENSYNSCPFHFHFLITEYYNPQHHKYQLENISMN